MVGKVIETVVVKDKVWVNCRDEHGSECAIYVQNTPKARSISDGDSFWWQSDRAYWTPKDRAGRLIGSKSDIILKRIGFSGVKRPSFMQPVHYKCR